MNTNTILDVEAQQAIERWTVAREAIYERASK